MRKAWIAWLFASAALMACNAGGDQVRAVAPVAETSATEQSDANTALVIPNGQGGLIVGSSESAGIELYGLDGARRAQIAAGATVGLDARPVGGDQTGWIVGIGRAHV